MDEKQPEASEGTAGGRSEATAAGPSEATAAGPSEGVTPANERTDSRAVRITAAAAERSVNQWPLMLVLGALAVSCVVLATGHWRKGAFAAGCAVLLGAALRAVLPRKVAGLLAVRSRVFDTLLLLVCGAAMVVLTMVVPPSLPGGR